MRFFVNTCTSVGNFCFQDLTGFGTFFGTFLGCDELAVAMPVVIGVDVEKYS